jgi:DNA gyrase subunit A
MIIEGEEDFSVEDLIAEEDVVITITHNGFIKRYPVSGYRRQSRGGKGITAAVTKDDDFIEHMFVASTHHYIISSLTRARHIRSKFMKFQREAEHQEVVQYHI